MFCPGGCPCFTHLTAPSHVASLFPYVYGPSWRWTTIPLVFLAGFAWLGIDGAAEECESPFDVRSVNALDMDSYCIGLMGTILQEIQNQADEERGTLARQSKA